MHLPTALAFALAGASASACTFGVMSKHSTTTADGGGGVGCNVLVWKEDFGSDETPWDSGIDNDFISEIDCGQGCDTVEYDGQTWDICHSPLPAHEADVTENTYVTAQHVDNNGDHVGLGNTDHFRNVTPFDTIVMNFWWQSISC